MRKLIAYPVGIIIGLYAALTLDPRLMLTLAAAAVVALIVNAVAPKGRTK